MFTEGRELPAASHAGTVLLRLGHIFGIPELMFDRGGVVYEGAQALPSEAVHGYPAPFGGLCSYFYTLQGEVRKNPRKLPKIFKFKKDSQKKVLSLDFFVKELLLGL